MSFFDDNDEFEEIMKEFFGERPVRKYNRREIIEGEEEERIIDFVEAKNKIFIIFELPGYSKEDITVGVDKKEIKVTAIKRNLEGIQDYLAKKLRRGVSFKKILPEFVNTKKFDYNFKNGILEVVFEKNER